MPLPIQIGSVTQALQRAFGFKGRYTPMLDEIIVPVYVIADPSPAQVTRLVAGFQSVSTIGGGVNAFIQVRNPPGSGVILNVTNVVINGEEKHDVQIRFFDDVTGTAFDATVSFRDRRIQGDPAMQLGRNPTNVGLKGVLVGQIQVDGSLSQSAAWETSGNDPRQPLVVLDEGQSVIFQDSLNEAARVIGASVRGLEIPITEQRPPGGLP